MNKTKSGPSNHGALIGCLVSIALTCSVLASCKALDHAILTPQVTNGQTNQVVKPAITGALDTAGKVAALTPWGDIVAPILLVTNALLALYAKSRNDSAKAGNVLVRTIEAMNDPALKQRIADALPDAQYSAVHAFVQNAVNSVEPPK